MKKIINILFISILTILLIPNVYAKDDVSIESINLIEKSEKTVELSRPSINGLKIGFDLTFSDVGDYAKYEVVVNNSTNKEYEINDETKFSTSNYIEYKYEFKEKTNRIKANSKATLYITVTYKNPVPADKLTDGKYIENNEMAISLSNQENPKTFNNFIYLLLILVSLIVISLLIKNKKIKSLSIIVIALLLVPTTIFALEKLKLDVSTKITIEKKYAAVFATQEIIKESEKSNYRILYASNLKKSGFTKEGQTVTSPFVGKLGGMPKIFINGEEYNIYPIIKEVRLYKEGETVNVNNYKIQILNNPSTCTFQEATSPADGDDKLICQESNLLTLNTNMGFYSTYYNPTAQENDPQVMNFQNVVEDGWNESYSAIAFETPSTFTMPKHDVLIGMDVD